MSAIRCSSTAGRDRSGIIDATAVHRELQADDRGRLDRDAFLDAQPANARLEQRLDRGRHRDLGVILRDYPAPALLPQRLAFDQHREHLLDVERVAFRRRDDARHHVGRQPGAAEHVLRDAGGRGIGQRMQHDAQRAVTLAPRGTLLEQLVPCGAQKQDRRGVLRLQHRFEQLEKCGLGPVDVVDEHDQRALLRERAEELARRPGDLVQWEGGAAQADRGAQPRGDVRVADHARDLRERDLRRVLHEDGCGLVHHLAQRPESDAVAVSEAAPADHACRGTGARDDLLRQP